MGEVGEVGVGEVGGEPCINRLSSAIRSCLLIFFKLGLLEAAVVED